MIFADPKLLEYLKNSLAQGQSREAIYKELLNQGWSIEVIQEGFNSINVETESENASKKTTGIIVIIGALLVAAGIFSLIAANWQEMTKLAKIAIIFIFMSAAYFFGWRLKEKYNSPRTGKALIFLGVLIYGAGIFLIAQMFNIRANWPDGFILWMLGAVAMAFVVESYSLFFFSILLGLIAVVSHPFGIIFTSLGRNPFLLTSSFLLLMATVVTFLAGWIIKKRISTELANFY